jgi:hypothetical protein
MDDTIPSVSCIVHENVDLAVGSKRLLRDTFTKVRRSDVARERDRFASSLTDLLSNTIALHCECYSARQSVRVFACIDISHHDACAMLCKQQRCSGPDAVNVSVSIGFSVGVGHPWPEPVHSQSSPNANKPVMIAT